MTKLKKAALVYGSLVLMLLLVVGVTFAAFTDKSKILGSSFSVGSADLKLLQDLAGGVDSANLVDELTGPTFDGIYPFWVGDYLVKIYNNATSSVNLTSNANYETANDPDDIRQIVFVEPFEWDDTNNDGLLDVGELGASLGARDTIIKYKTVGYDFGALNSGEIKGIVLRFSTDSVSDTKQGASGIFDFEFDSVGL